MKSLLDIPDTRPGSIVMYRGRPLMGSTRNMLTESARAHGQRRDKPRKLTNEYTPHSQKGH